MFRVSSITEKSAWFLSNRQQVLTPFAIRSHIKIFGIYNLSKHFPDEFMGSAAIITA